MLGFSSFRYLLNIPGPLDIPACLCKGNFDDDIFNNQVPYLWLIYWWDIPHCGEERYMLSLSCICSWCWLLSYCAVKSLTEANLKRCQGWLFTRQKQVDFTVILSVMFKCTLSFCNLTKSNCEHFSSFLKQPLSSSSIKY